MPNEVQLAIAQAQLLAEQTRPPQTIDLRVERRHYDALLEKLNAAGTVTPGAGRPCARRGSLDREGQLTILPVR